MNSSNVSGFTLVELLVVTAILGVVLAAVGNLFMTSTEIYSVQDQVVRVQQDVRSVLNLMSGNIRMAGLNPTGNAVNAGIMHANATTIRVLYDYDANGTCSDPNEDFDFRYDPIEKTVDLKRGGAGGYQTLGENVELLQFRYELFNGNSTSSPSDLSKIRLVSIQLCGAISGSYSEKYSQNYCFNSTVQCRNMGL